MSGRKMIDLTGNRYFRLVVLSFYGKIGKKRYGWLCKCDCGNTKVILSDNLSSGRTGSCGCYSSEKTSEKFTKHGQRNTRLYRIWLNMKDRCNNPENAKYRLYGGRGVSVCALWSSDFVAFMEWSRKNGYADNLTIDRIDNAAGYYPENCRWATYRQQANNRRNNVLVDIGGTIHTLYEWAGIYGTNYKTASTRYYRGDVGEAIFRPVKRTVIGGIA